MRIPHIINKNTLEVYSPSPQSLSLIGENLRKIISENFDWNNDHCPTLVEFAVQAISKNFEQKSLLDELPCADKDYLLEILSTNIPMELAIPKIYYEYYWRRRCLEKFKLNTKPIDITWKKLYIERHVQYMIENAQPQYRDEYEMDELLTLCNDYVTKLVVTQFQNWEPPLTIDKDDIPEVYPTDHINFEPIFKKLTNLEEVNITFGVTKMPEKFKLNLFKVSIPDCEKLGKAVNNLKYLKILKIRRSFVEDRHCQALMKGLINNKTLEELDLSHCMIRDDGTLCIAKVLTVHPTLRVLNLCNNYIEQKGAEGLGYALMLESCAPLFSLNLRLNPLGHAGCMGIFRALVRTNKPQILNLAACGFEEDTPKRLCTVLKLNMALLKLDISNNFLKEEGGEELINGLIENRMIKWLECRETDLTPEQMIKVNRLILRNRTGFEEISSEEEILESESEEESQSFENLSKEEDKQ